MELSIPELRERIKTVAEKRFDDEVRSLPLEEVIGEIIHIELDQNAISIFDVKKNMYLNVILLHADTISLLKLIPWRLPSLMMNWP